MTPDFDSMLDKQLIKATENAAARRMLEVWRRAADEAVPPEKHDAPLNRPRPNDGPAGESLFDETTTQLRSRPPSPDISLQA